MKPLFKVGDRVRMTLWGRRMRPKKKFHTGIIKSITYRAADGAWRGVIQRDGTSSKSPTVFYVHADDEPEYSFWEKIPVGELTQDETGRQLAQAFLDGDVSALDPLVDRILELKLGM